MPCLRYALLLILATVAAGADNPFPMRWRVFCDTAGGDSFRYPYDYFPIDQYKGDLKHFSLGRGSDGSTGMVDPDSTTGKGADVDRPDIHHFTFTDAEMSSKGFADLSAVGDSEAKATLTWKPYNYYELKPSRPFADPRWADEGIEATIGESGKVCAIVVRHGSHVSGLVLKGGISSGDNERMLDSLEVLSTGHRLKKGDKLPKKFHYTDWVAAHCGTKVLDHEGKLITPAFKNPPGAWPAAWEIETQHYHVTTDFSPVRLLGHGEYLEALFQAYSKVYQPDAMPPYKFEVHIYSTSREFQEASAAWGDPIPVGPGQIVGGFFQPMLLSLWVYEESGALGGESFSIEHVMAHECSHQFLHVVCNGSSHIPTWINEGLAVYFEAGVFQNGQFVIKTPTERISRLKNQYQQLNTTIWPLNQYLDHHSYISADMYGEVYAMTMFWVFATCSPDFATCKHKNCGYRRFLEFMTALRNHEDGNKAFERIFMDDMVKAQGGDRVKAIANWQEAMLEFVKTRLK